MSGLTKAQLAAENAALRKQLGDAQHDLHLARGGVRVPNSLRALPEHMQRAKQLAMSAGITVRVGS